MHCIGVIVIHVDIDFDVKITVVKIELGITDPSNNCRTWYIVPLKGTTIFRVQAIFQWHDAGELNFSNIPEKWVIYQNHASVRA